MDEGGEGGEGDVIFQLWHGTDVVLGMCRFFIWFYNNKL